jgi:hypothetical protein
MGGGAEGDGTEKNETMKRHKAPFLKIPVVIGVPLPLRRIGIAETN